jgi:hypothetical protein
MRAQVRIRLVKSSGGQLVNLFRAIFLVLQSADKIFSNGGQVLGSPTEPWPD